MQTKGTWSTLGPGFQSTVPKLNLGQDLSMNLPFPCDFPPTRRSKGHRFLPRDLSVANGRVSYAVRPVL